jgi:hypothetical protein
MAVTIMGSSRTALGDRLGKTASSSWLGRTTSLSSPSTITPHHRPCSPVVPCSPRHRPLGWCCSLCLSPWMGRVKWSNALLNNVKVSGASSSETSNSSMREYAILCALSKRRQQGGSLTKVLCYCGCWERWHQFQYPYWWLRACRCSELLHVTNI